MARRALLLLSTAFLAFPAYAGPKPPDVAAYSPVTPQYEAGSTQNLPLDAGSVTPWRGLTGIESPSETGMKATSTSVGDDTGEGTNDYVLCEIESGGHPGRECKFRTTCATTFIAKDDPIRNSGMPGTSHLHLFFGAEQVNAWSTYASLRNSKRSKCAGYNLNNTAYWRPAWTKLMGGINYAVIGWFETVYYNNHIGHRGALIPNGLRFVSAADMDDNYEWMDTVIAAANAQPGTAGRYGWGSLGKPHTRYYCQGTATSPGDGTPNPQNYIKKPDGTDPWGGTCTSGKQINAQTGFSPCWDGVNLWSTDGYRHVIPKIWDSLYSKFVCPKNYYEIPVVELHDIYAHGGFSDYGTWTLSSDAAFQTMLNAGPEPRTIGSGESSHADWMDGWDPSIRNTWQANCGGSENGRGHECGDSRINDTTHLSIGSPTPDGRRSVIVPIPTQAQVTPTSTANMWRAPTTTSGTHEHTVSGSN